ncbi:MAG TPA: hypothetical protein PLH37_03165 [bacterium]|nr:hypothetical protein [bacterium]
MSNINEKISVEQKPTDITTEFITNCLLNCTYQTRNDFIFYLNKKRSENNFIVRILYKEHKENCIGIMAFFKSFAQQFTIDTQGQKTIEFIFIGTEEEKLELMRKDENATNAFASGVRWKMEE